MKINSIVITTSIVIISILSGGFYWYYNHAQNQIEVLNKNLSETKTALEINENTIGFLIESNKNKDAEIERVNEEFNRIREQNRTLEERLSKHEIGALAENKPGLVENVINNATEKAFRCFEIMSGAKLTDEEKNAKDGKSFNSECPWLWNDFSD